MSTRRKLLEEEAEAQSFIDSGRLRQACEGKISQAAIDVIVYAVMDALEPVTDEPDPPRPAKKKAVRR